MLNALIDLVNKHRPSDANWREVHQSENHDDYAVIIYNDGSKSTLLLSEELVQFAEVLIQAETVRLCKKGKEI